MVVVRESPNAREPRDQPQWPPRSPHEALLSSPSGRKRLQRIREGRSPSPSPRRPLRESPRKAMSIESSDSQEDEDEDEETLQLKLKALEAKLKLKRLQKKKDAGNQAKGRIEPPEIFEPEVHVPVSPARKRIEVAEPKSPARQLLGIDKGLKAGDVSLKRPRIARPDISSSRTSSAQSTRAREIPKIKSFSERMAESRIHAQQQVDKEQKVQEARSKGFSAAAGSDVGNGQGNSLRSAPRSHSSSRPSTVSTQSPEEASKTISASRSVGTKPPTSSIGALIADIQANATPEQNEVESERTTDAERQAAPTSLETYSGVHLSRRHIEHGDLTRTLQGKKLYPIPRLLHEIIAPDYSPPDCEADYVVFGIICSKSTPRDHKDNPKTINSSGPDEHTRPKFMVFRLTDFKYEVDLFLFGSGFERFWKMKEGTLIAVLNPGIMPPRVKDTGAFSLKVSSSEDIILEIGQARDLGFCKSLKADGNQCTTWVDKRKTEVCEYHISLQVNKARADRMQFGTMTGAPGTFGGGRGERSGVWTSSIKNKNSKYVKSFGGLAKEGKYHDRDIHETMYIMPKEMGLNTASLLDKEYTERMFDQEAKRKRKRDMEKEKELARSLGLSGNGTGSEYLKHRNDLQAAKDKRKTTMVSSKQATGVPPSTDPLEPPDAAALGLLGKTAQQVSLSPVKKHFKFTAKAKSAPMGWGGALKRGLLDTEQPEPTTAGSLANTSSSPRKSSMRQSPVEENEGSPRKRARLLLDGKGIRLPGRESLGAAPGDIFLNNDDDDDLEIV